MTCLLFKPKHTYVWLLSSLLALLAHFGGGLVGAATPVQAQSCTFPITVSNATQLNAAITCFNGQTTPGEYGITLGADILLSASTTAINNGAAGVRLRIDGAGHAVDGQGVLGRRPFTINGGAVILERITITGGNIFSDDGGGGIYNQGALTVTHTSVIGNQIEGHERSNGGGIYNRGTLTVIHSTFTGNQTGDSAAGGGGAIYNDIGGLLFVTHSTFIGNRANNAHGQDIRAGGGAIYNLSTELPFLGAEILAVRMKVINSTFSNNSAAQYGGAILNGFGGAAIANSTFHGNSVDAGQGGAIFNEARSINPSTKLWVYNTILANTPSGGSCGGNNVFGDHNLIEDGATCGLGGIIGQPAQLGPLADNEGPTLTHALLEGSPAIDAGDNAALVTAANGICLFTNGDFGAPADCSENVAAVIPAITTDQRGEGFARIAGGWVDIGAYEAQLPCPTFPTMVNSRRALNNAIDCFSSQTTPGEYRITLSSDILLTVSTLPIANTTAGVSLRIDGAGHKVDGQGLQGVRPFEIAANTTVVLEQMTISGGNAGDGGGILNIGGALTVHNSTISHNTANFRGGGIFNNGGTLTVNNSTLSYNNAISSLGGGIFNEGGALTVHNSTIGHDTATDTFDLGGGIFNNGGALTVNNSTLSYNNGAFGGIRNRGGATVIVNSSIINNTALGFNAGGISNEGGTLTVVNSTISYNTSSSQRGGGIDNDSNGTLTLINSTLNNNTSMGGFGGLYNFGGTANLINTIIASTPPSSDCTNTTGGTVNASHSLIEGGLGCVNGTNTNNLTGDPLLGPLQDNDAPNGRPTFTHALLPGSPAIDKGDNAVCADPATVNNQDQRGVARPQGAACDIGAFELEQSSEPDDTTPPDTTIISGPADPSASGDASFTFTGEDDVTAAVNLNFECRLDGGIFSSCTSGHSYSGLADGSHTFEVRAIDEAGNVDPTPASHTWLIDTTPADTTPPIAIPTQEPLANANGWNNTDVTVTWNWTDDQSGIDPANCTSNSTSSGEGELTLSATCADLAGNPGSASHTVKVDMTKPTISAAATSVPNAAGWYNSNVTVAFTCTDALSGIPDGGCPAAQLLDSEGTAVAATEQTVTDAAGNSSTPSNVVTVQIDKTAPVVTVTGVSDGASYPLGSAPAVGCDTQDALSGVATPATLSATGGNPDGTGSFTVTCSGATDHAGNSGSASLTYNVLYHWSGFFPPVDNLPVVNTVNAGQVIPVKFSLGGNYGLNIFASGYPQVQPVSCGGNGSTTTNPIDETVTAGNSSLQYDPATQTYTYVWKTDKAWAGTCRQLVVRLVDGSEHVALFQLNGKRRSAEAGEEAMAQQLFLPLVNR